MALVTTVFKGGRVHSHLPDAKFKWQGKSVVMTFHEFCGPIFEVVTPQGLEAIMPTDEKEFDDLWKQFEGWWKVKGKKFSK